MPWRLLALFLVAVLQPACLQIPDYDETGCGDSILGAGEDCDGRYVSEDGTCGAPGTEHACHYVCSNSSESPACPPGWGCGNDDRCYQPQLQLASPEMDVPMPIPVTDVVDMDSDGFDDLVGTSELSISTRFSDGAGRFDDAFNLVLPPGSGPKIWVAPLDDDDGDDDYDDDDPNDALIPLGPALLVLSGQETRGFGSRLFPTEILPQTAEGTVQEAAGVALEADRERFAADSELLVLSEYAQPGGTTRSAMAFHIPRCEGPGEPLPDGQQVSDLGGKGVVEAGTRIPRADLDGDGFTEFALSFRGSSKLYLYGTAGSPASTDPATCLRPVPYARSPEIATPDGYMLSDQNPLFVDIDGDTDLDVLIGIAVAAPPPFPRPILTHAVAVGEAVGDGTYDTQATIVPGLAGLLEEQRPVLAAGDIDGDGLAEYVTPGAILRIDQPPDLPAQVVPLTGPSGALWVTAEVLDLNGDGALDVVAAAPGGLDWFINATPTGLKGQLNRFVLAAPPGEPQLRTGDFNGDLQPDVAAVARVGMSNEMAVVFGNFAGIPGEVQPIGGFGGRLHFVETGLTPEPSAAVLDGLSDLFLWTSTDPPEEDQPKDVAFFTLHGSTSQRLLSPFHVVGAPGDASGSEVVVAAAGNFVDSLLGVSGALFTQRSVAVVSKPTATNDPAAYSGFTLLISPRRGELRPARLAPEPILPLSTFDVINARWLVGDVAPDEAIPSDELVGIETSRASPSNPTLTIAVMSMRQNDHALEVEPIELPAEYSNITAARLADVDHDGRPDLVLILVRTGGQEEVRILWNGRCSTSRFCTDGTGSTSLELEAVNGQDPPPVGQPLDIVAMQLTGNDSLEVVVLYAELDGDPQPLRRVFSFAEGEDAPGYRWKEVTFARAPNSTPRSLAAGDVNGDGLDDLVVSADPFASVLLQQPAAPLGSTEGNQTSDQAGGDQTEEEIP